MAVRIESHAEPIPGYRLIERLGGGGFGEVWKAEAPGGLFKAIKFVFGDLQSINSEDGSRAEQELKALSRVKTVHHPYILSLERFDIVDGQLMIVMELADKTLWDRFRECRDQGLPGIPRAELLNYMQETAEALDLMIGQYQLQHLDIKPQNLFLVYNHIKVADFGLVKDLEGISATVTGGVTPVYAAPETFDGWISRFTDQYSLAIVYQELLTGERPFAGSTMRQLVLQHLQGEPNLASLPLKDKPIILRALSKNPDHRFPTCQEMVQALRSAERSAPAPVSTAEPMVEEAVADVRNETASRVIASSRPDAELPQEATVRARRKEKKADGSEKEQHRPRLLPELVPGKKTLGEEETPGQLSSAAGTVRSLVAEGTDRDGVVQPAVIVGLGKLGIKILQHFRHLMHQELTGVENVPHVRLLGLDTDAEAIQGASQGDAPWMLRPHEVLLARLYRASHYLKPKPGKNPLDGWLNAKLLYRIPRQQNQAGLRPLGRLAFVDNYRVIARRLESELQQCTAAANPNEGNPTALRSRVPRVYVVGSLAGATGGGMFLDTAYTLRRLLRGMGHVQAEVIGLFLLPPASGEAPDPVLVSNTYAALGELDCFASGKETFSAYYDLGDGAQQYRETGPPFQRCLCLTWADKAGKGRQSMDAGIAEAVQQAGRVLFYEVASPAGQAVDLLRKQSQGGSQRGSTYQTVGLCQLSWPRRRIRRRAARNLCQRLVQRWMSKDAQAVSEEVGLWAQEQWETMELRAEDLILRHRAECEKVLKEAPEKKVGAVLQALTALKQAPDTVFNPGPVIKALDGLEKLLGLPVENSGPLVREPGAIEKALEQAAARVADQCEQKLAELAVQLIEEPRFRLAGTEEALRKLNTAVEQALQAQEILANELQERCLHVHERIQAILEKPNQVPPQSSSLWKFSRKPTQNLVSPSAELADLVPAYAKARYQGLVLHHVTALYVSLRGNLSDQIREVGFCRQRLKDLAELVTEPGKDREELEVASPRAKSLLPKGCLQLDDAVAELDKKSTEEDLVKFDQRVQGLIREQFRALVQVCMGPVNVVRNLAPAMLLEAEAFLEPFLEGTHVGEVFLAQYAEGEEEQRKLQAQQDLFAAFEAASPQSPGACPGAELCLVTVPAAAGDAFVKLVQSALPGAKVVPAQNTDEILILREYIRMGLGDLEQAGAAPQDIYRQRLAKDPIALHTRQDISVTPGQPASATRELT